MRYLLLMLLGLSLPALAEDAPQSSQTAETTPPADGQANSHLFKEKTPPKEKVVESKELCDPKERTKMPETFY